MITGLPFSAICSEDGGKYVKGVLFFNRRYIKGTSFLPKRYIKGKGLDLGAEPPRIKLC